MKDFVNVAVDGQLVDSSCYTLAEGSTVLTFLSFYLDTLSIGDHVVTLNYTYGSIDTTLTILDRSAVNNSANTPGSGNSGDAGANGGNGTKQTAAGGTPKTGDARLIWPLCLMFLSSGVVMVMLSRKNKRVSARRPLS